MLNKLAGSEGISVADLAAHLDLVGIFRRDDRLAIYHHVVALEQERRRLVNPEE